MIIPDKNIRLQNSLLGMGAIILSEIKGTETISSLWEKSKTKKEINSFEKFILTIDFLFMLELIELKRGVVEKVRL